MANEEYDSEAVEGGLQPGGGVQRDDFDSVEGQFGFHTGGVVEGAYGHNSGMHEGEELLARPEVDEHDFVQQTEQEQLEELDVAEPEEEEAAETTPDGRAILKFQYVGTKPEYRTQFGTYRPGNTYRLPENKAKTLLGMKQPDNSPAFKLEADL